MSEQETIEKNRIECELRTKELYKDKTVYMWRMVFKSAPYGVSAESKYDLQTRRRYTDISNKGYHDFATTIKKTVLLLTTTEKGITNI